MNKKIIVNILLGTCVSFAGGLDLLEPQDMTPQKDVVIEGVEVDPTGRFDLSSISHDVYFGIGFGRMKANESTTATGASVSLIAGLTLSEYASLEGRYTTLMADADIDGDVSSVSMSNMALYIKQLLPLTKTISPYGLIGYGSSKYAGEKDSSLQWGLGLNYAYSDSGSLFFDYVSFYSGDFDGAISEDVDLDAFNLGTTYKF